ncbi:hypothetical protein [Lentibacillus sp. CBA3610]|uniref:hypothetical protein n=1 Tax=Lentibacillus sp. CBA3610 TaxID=2518176 RepID=UPI001595AF00|nr:hypothetical protein [Lentibacillus sp. CBA3610]QKY71490.1 hypothetical protein Len3610_19825 [Lentibacillus sp. CBA3610]
MRQPAVFLKVARDVFWMQLSWAFGFLGIMLAINIFKIIRSIIQGSGVDNYYNAVFVAGNIFMFVLGILFMYFLPYYVENGVTRRDYFKGGLIASVGLSVIIPIIASGISAVEQFVITNVSNLTFNEPDINSVVLEIDSNIIGDIIQSAILTPYIDPASNWILAMAVFSINIFIYYLLGWFISASFYRFDTVTGLGFILIALITLMLQDTLLRISLGLPVLERFAVLESLPSGIIIPGMFLVILILIWVIRLLTKRIAIKM